MDQVSPDLAAKVLAADVRNAVKDVGDGEKLTAAHRRQMEVTAMTPELAAQKRAAAHLLRYCEGEDLTAAQWEEIRATHPGFAAVPPPPSVAAEATTPPAEADEHRAGKLSMADARRYGLLYKGSEKGWRTMYRWIEVGEAKGEPCPLHDAAKMPGWLTRNLPRALDERIEQAAVDAARAGAPAPSPATTSAKPTPSPQIPTPQPTMPAASVAPDAAGSAPVKPGVRLEDIDPEEGDRLRELKQMQVVKFTELKEALELGKDTAVLETKYIKFCETLDKIESRVIERAKKRGLYVLREDVDKDLAANAELLRQTRESMPRRVLEQCSSLTADQRIEVSAAIVRARAKEDSILCRLDCLAGEDLLKEMVA